MTDASRPQRVARGAEQKHPGETAFVIGLPDSFRGDPLLDDLEANGFIARRVDGVVVRDLKVAPEAIYAAVDAEQLMRRSMTEGEIGCAMAHRNVYETLLAEGTSHAFVFEDDARLVRPLDIDSIVQLLDVDAPRLISFYCAPGYFVELRGKGVTMPDGHYDRAAIAPTTTTAYALNLPAARLLLKANTPIRTVADWPPSAASHIDFLVPKTLPVEPLPDASSLDDDRLQATTAAPSGASSVGRRIAVLMHLPWWSHRALYGDWPTYVQHELLRMAAFRFTRRGEQGRRGGVPLPLRAALSAMHQRSHRLPR